MAGIRHLVGCACCAGSGPPPPPDGECGPCVSCLIAGHWPTKLHITDSLGSLTLCGGTEGPSPPPPTPGRTACSALWSGAIAVDVDAWFDCGHYEPGYYPASVPVLYTLRCDVDADGAWTGLLRLDQWWPMMRRQNPFTLAWTTYSPVSCVIAPNATGCSCFSLYENGDCDLAVPAAGAPQGPTQHVGYAIIATAYIDPAPTCTTPPGPLNLDFTLDSPAYGGPGGGVLTA